MKKTTWLAILAIALITTISSCSKTETYADKLKNEKKVLKRFLSESNIQLTHTYPSECPFPDNVFFVDPKTGVYFHVVDSGNGERFSVNEKVHTRYAGARILPSKNEETNDGNGEGNQPMTFIYGVPTTYLSAKDFDHGWFVSPGAAAPLEYVGKEAIVKLVIPFKIGSSYQLSAFSPVYIDYYKYKAEPQ